MQTALTERTVECNPCYKASITPPYIAYTVSIQSKPLFCPKCAHQRTVRPYDYVDVLCTDHAGLSRQQASRIIFLYNEQRARGTLKRPTITLDPIDYINDMGAKGMPSLRTFITPLDVSCHDCGGCYTLLRNVPDVQRTPPLYCIWCASSNVHIEQQSTEDTAWTCLATHYNLPLPFIKVLFDRWTHHSNKPTFKDYMESDLIKQLLVEVS